MRLCQAASGKEALQAIQERKPLLVISDIVMPEMDGYELTRRIKTDKMLNDIPVILLTTLSTADDIVSGIDAQVDYFLHKPVDGNFLVSRIRSVLSAPAEANTEQVRKPGSRHQRPIARRLRVGQGLVEPTDFYVPRMRSRSTTNFGIPRQS